MWTVLPLQVKESQMLNWAEKTKLLFYPRFFKIIGNGQFYTLQFLTYGVTEAIRFVKLDLCKSFKSLTVILQVLY